MTGSPKPARQPTIKQVALQAGVSPMTVSRTLAGGLNVRPDVQERVLDAVKSLGSSTASRLTVLKPVSENVTE